MIGRIFLGRPWHWGLLIAAAGLLWYCGSKRLHVIEFNSFIIVMLLGVVASIVALVAFHTDGEQVTRDGLVADDPSAYLDARPPRE